MRDCIGDVDIAAEQIKLGNSRLWPPEVVALFDKSYEYMHADYTMQNLFLNKELSAIEEHIRYLLKSCSHCFYIEHIPCIAQGLQPA